VCVLVNFYAAATTVLTTSFVSKYPNFKKWYERCAELKEFKDALQFKAWVESEPTPKKFSNSSL